MTDQDKTKTDLLSELGELRSRLARLESCPADGHNDRSGCTTSDGHYRAIFENATEGILLTEAPTRKIVHANPAVCRMFGRTADDMIGRLVDGLHPEDIREGLIIWFESHSHNFGSEDIEILCLGSDGKTFAARLRTSCVEIDGRPHIMAFFSDVTDLRRVEELTRVQRDLAQTLNATNDLDIALRACLATVISVSGMDSGGIYLVKAKTGDLDLVCSQGLSPKFVQLVSHINADSPRAQVVMAGEPLYLTYVQLTESIGTNAIIEQLRATAVVPVKHDGRVIACLNLASHTLNEIPELSRQTIETIAASIGSAIVRLRAQQAVFASENRFRELTELLPQVVFEVDAKGYVTYSNRFGFESDLLDQKTIDGRLPMLDLVAATDRDKAKEQFSAILSGERRLGQEYTLLRKDGTTFPALVYASPIVRDGETVGSRGVVLDITERKQAEKELERTKALLSAAIEQSVAGIMIAETPGARIRVANAAALDIFGAPTFTEECPAGSLQMGNWAFFRPDGGMLATDQMPLIQAVKHGRTSRNVEAIVWRKDGTQRQLQINAAPVRDGDGRIIAGVSVVSDVTDGKLAEKTLREREARLSGIMLSAPIGIGIVSNRVLRHVNKTFCDMVGYSEEELVNRSVAMLYFTGDEFDRVGAEYFRTTSSGISGIETEWRRKDGSLIEIILSLTPLDRGDRSKGMTFTALDITERKKAERNLLDAKEQYRVLFERAGEGITVFCGEYFLFANPAFSALSGYSVEELPSLPIRDFIHPDHREMVMDRYRRRLSGEQVPTGYEFKIVTKTGQTKWVRINSTVISWMGKRVTLNFMEDITVRRANQEEIRKFKTISDNAAYGTAISDLNGTFLYVNAAFARMHDYRPEELLGLNMAILHSDEQMGVVRRLNEEVVRTGSFTSIEVWHRRRDGTEFPTLMNGVLIHNEAGEPQFLAATAADITELKRLQGFADRARQLEAAGRIAGQVAHDFNNLLGPLVAYPEFIKEEIGADHSANVYLDTMEAAALQMADINQQLLSLGRRGHYNLEPLNLNEAIRQVLQQLELQTERLEVVTDLAGDLMNIKAGTAQIMRVFLNLISNAVDAMQRAGTLSISTQNWYADESLGSCGQIPQGEYAKVIVSDTGCGIPENIIGQVFEPFFTTKKADKKRGSGLGLSVVHSIVDDHGGYIDIESREGLGTRVFLYFPVTRETQTTPDEHQIAGGTESVLLVDDDLVQQEVTLKLLRKLGYRVTTVGSGEAAMERTRIESFDILLLDMIMPGGIDGVETLRAIKQRWPDQKAIIVSGFAEGGKVAEAQQLGAGAFLKKPLTMKSLAQAVRGELDRVAAPQLV